MQIYLRFMSAKTFKFLFWVIKQFDNDSWADNSCLDVNLSIFRPIVMLAALELQPEIWKLEGFKYF